MTRSVVLPQVISRDLWFCNDRLRRYILVNDQREHPSSSPPLYVSACVCPGLSTYVTDVTDVLVNDQREHPSSSPPFLVNDQREHPSSSPPIKAVSACVRLSRSLNLCNGCPLFNLCNGCCFPKSACFFEKCLLF